MMATAPTARGGLFSLRRFGGRTFWSTVLTVFWVALLVGIVGTYSPLDWAWTGFKENGNLWSWLQLLSAPIFLATLPLAIKEVQSHRGGTETQGVGKDPLVGVEHQQQVLDAYQTYILDLMMNKGLGNRDSAQDVREVARVRTLAALRRVGDGHKSEVLRFVYEAGLVDRDAIIVSLLDADLSGANLSGIALSGSDLTGVNLSNAQLKGTDLSGACLTNARLAGADLTDADLSGACLEGADCAQEQLIAARRWP
jgi:hypothetical protein